MVVGLLVAALLAAEEHSEGEPGAVYQALQSLQQTVQAIPVVPIVATTEAVGLPLGY